MHTATASQYGTVRIGDNINVTDNTYGNAGIISVPLASDSVAGVIKVGSGLSMDSNGTLSLSSSGSSFAFSVGAGLGAPEI
jgi:hypothetical protein